ncbi:NADP-dependent oxidoreductase [Deinococcus taeanensis]|uniref:NADP-dependent oxidoreductase n=1 Tax=Deinococcus taeanensis TaxID=2737050 RepID=UPI001CDC667B|nr:NADP-dependent oxidoreductase [Deinococcus taeanensis]UBV42662.1 NADP-dependent oxidoreductase [Deinococcus taeanensis]
MKAVQIRAYGAPEQLEVTDVPTPAPGLGEVLVRVRAVSINPVDYKWRAGGPLDSFPLILGWDVSGVVEAVGPYVMEFRPGDEVFGMLNFPQPGRAYAEYVTARVADIALKPAGLSHEDAAAMSLAALTAHQGLEKMKLRAGQGILIHAGAGGVGHYAVQLARARGAHVTATASAANEAFVRALGADRIVDYRAQPFETQVRDMDAVLDTVGGDTLSRSFEVVRPGGWVVSIAAPIPPEARGVRAARILVYPSRAHLEALADLVRSGQLRSHVSQVFPLARVADAHRAQATGRTVGKIVLTVS